MTGIQLPPKSLVFIALALLTAANWFIVEDVALATAAATAAILIGATKIRLVFVEFMELENRVQPWRLLFELWLALITASVLAGYWSTRL